MNPYNLDISGDWYADPETLDKFSRDMSAYRIVPALVVAPKNEEDILNTLRFARNEGLGIVSRSGGSGLSGASIGPGIILNFKKHLNQAVRLGNASTVEPGMILDQFVKQISARNLMLPAVPSSSAVCALGGNVGTRATGPRTAKYGTLVGEHNAGRSRSVYLKMELGPAYTYLREIKKLFDPEDLLNPGSLFDTEPITSHMDFTPMLQH